MTKTLFGMLTFTFIHQGYTCEAEVFIEPPKPEGESDWDLEGLQYVNDIYIDGFAGEAEDLGLDEKEVFKYFSAWEATQELEFEV